MTTMTYGQLVEAYVAVRDERDQLRDELQIAEDRLDWLRKRIQLAMDLLCSPTVPHEKGPDVPGAYGILSHALATTAPETGPTAPQTDEQAQVRGESHTESQTGSDDPLTTWCRTQLSDADIKAWLDEVRRERERQTGSQGPLDLDAIRAAWLRACGSCDAGYPTDCTCPPGDPRTVIAALVAEIDRLRELANEASEAGITNTDQPASARVDLVVGLRQRGVPQHPDGPEAAALAEIDRLRAEVKHLSARVREWEAVHADLAARCDSGDIPIRFGERYSQAVLREIDRVRTERDRLLEELPEDHTIAAAIRGLRAARSATPDTGSTTP